MLGSVVCGSRTWMCTMAAPALAASIAEVAICAGVTGTAGLLRGESADPVTAQEIITFRCIFSSPPCGHLTGALPARYRWGGWRCQACWSECRTCDRRVGPRASPPDGRHRMRSRSLILAMTILLAAAVAASDALAGPKQIIILRHGEKYSPFELCKTGVERSHALALKYLGRGVEESLFPSGEGPAAFFAINPQ